MMLFRHQVCEVEPGGAAAQHMGTEMPCTSLSRWFTPLACGLGSPELSKSVRIRLVHYVHLHLHHRVPGEPAGVACILCEDGTYTYAGPQAVSGLLERGEVCTGSVYQHPGLCERHGGSCMQ